MNNMILKSLAAENFTSFAERVEFTTEADTRKKEYPGNTFYEGETAFNKVSFMYGANGSGKTLFCKIIREIQRMLDWSPLTAVNNPQLLTLPQLKGLDVPIRCFAFDESYKEKPTVLSIEIILDGTTYHYEFSVSDRNVEYELLTKKRHRTEKLIERTSPAHKDIFLRSDLKGFESTKQVVKEEALCLPVAALLNNPLAQKIVSAIKGIQVVSMTAARLNPPKPRESLSEERVNKYLRIIQNADPTVRKIEISFEEEEVARQKLEGDDFENREIIATKTTVGVDTLHAVFDNGKETGSIPITFFADESLGTVKLFTALPYLYDTLESGGVLVIDELENGLHLSLAKEIVSLFTDERSNPNNAQLICTSHQPLLLTGSFRRDQVWVAAKDSYGKSSLHRMSDLPTPRAKVDLVNKVLEGAFGCNPNKFFDNNT